MERVPTTKTNYGLFQDSRIGYLKVKGQQPKCFLKMYNDRYVKTPQRRVGDIHYNAGYVSTICYINRTGGAIYIKDRSGCIIEIPPNNNARALEGYEYGCLTIQELNYGSLSNHENIRHQVYGIGEEYCSRRHIARANSLPAEELRTDDRATFITTFVVDLRGSINSPISRYIRDYDIVVSAGGSFNEAALAEHPGSKADQVRSSAKAFNPGKDIYVKIRNIQNKPNARSYWTILDGQVCEIYPTQDSYAEDGLYISFRDPLSETEMADYFTGCDDERLKSTKYRFFKTYDEAAAALSDDATEIYRLKVEELRLKNESLAAMAEKLKRESEQSERKFREDAIRHANAIREMEMSVKKTREEYELKSIENSRKNTADTFKYVTTVLGAIATVASILIKK